MRILSVILLLVSLTSLAEKKPIMQLDSDQLFDSRYMKTVFFPLSNVNFSDSSILNNSQVIGVNNLMLSPQPKLAQLVERPNGKSYVQMTGAGGGEQKTQIIFQDIKLGQLQPEPVTLSASAWVWSDKPEGAYLKLSDRKGRSSISAFHSGSASWEYITVVFPYAERPENLRVSLLTMHGEGRFDHVKLLATYDNRFMKVLPDGCNPLRERVTYAKDRRIRIVVVGNSTVNGHAVADKRASFPYILQLKLEALFPGKFEVMNFGLCGWHLPPQIITIDKTFNSNKACDGAAWCAGKDGQFSHKNVLTVEKNDDNNTPTIAELKPDIIIFAGMWNDAWRVLKYAGWGIPPNADEVNRFGDTPASVEYLRAVFNYADSPSETNYQLATKKFEQAMKPLDSSLLSKLEFHDHLSIMRSEEFQMLVENASIKLAYLSEEFIGRAKKYGEVWAMTLPGRFGNAYKEVADKLYAGGQLSKNELDSFLINGYIDSVSEQIQNTETLSVSQKMNIKVLNLSDVFHMEYEYMPISKKLMLGYFLTNIEDNVHFAYRGNEWIADRMFLGFIKEFDRLSGGNESLFSMYDIEGEDLVR